LEALLRQDRSPDRLEEERLIGDAILGIWVGIWVGIRVRVGIWLVIVVRVRVIEPVIPVISVVSGVGVVLIAANWWGLLVLHVGAARGEHQRESGRSHKSNPRTFLIE
jgi:hypothetical protein